MAGHEGAEAAGNDGGVDRVVVGAARRAVDPRQATATVATTATATTRGSRRGCIAAMVAVRPPLAAAVAAVSYPCRVPGLVAACVWPVTPEVLTALDDRFGPPVDAYVNGAQVWLRDAPPPAGGVTLEWRLHPPAGYRRPEATGTYEVFEAVTAAIAAGLPGPAPLDRLWEGLEAFAAYGDEVEPAILAAACTTDLGVPPAAAGLVDHAAVGDEWERSGGNTSIVAALLAQLAPPA
jgi:hypothetical protein